MRYKFIEEKTASLLKTYGFFKVPVLVEDLTKSLKIGLEPIESDENVSGFFLTKGSAWIIGYNKAEPKNRIRFTIAHELGHWYLHSKELPLFIDGKEKVRFYRDDQSSTGEFRYERDANAFAAALLMPEELVRREAAIINGLDGRKLVQTLALLFQVSRESMAYRLANLELIEVGL